MRYCFCRQIAVDNRKKVACDFKELKWAKCGAFIWIECLFWLRSLYFIFFFQYEMIGKEYPLEGMEPYDQEDAIKVQEKLIGMGIPAVLAEF